MTRELVILANTTWSRLEAFNTRVKNVAVTAAGRADISAVTVVDYPVFGPRQERDVDDSATASWHPGVRNLRAHVRTTGERRSAALDAAAFRLSARHLRRRLGEPTAVRTVICASPASARLLGRLGEDEWLFDAIDDLRSDPSTWGVARRLADGYDEVARLRCPVSAVSRQLAEDLHGTWIPNGVDLESFVSASPDPEVLRLSSGTVAVYAGTIEGRVDVDLVTAVARAMPDVAFVFVGPVADGDVAAALTSAGVHLLGPVPHGRVPAILRAADVCLLPHRRTAFTASMNPLKLYEYLASGRPVVTTGVAGVEVFADAVTVADSADAFAAAIRAVLRDPGEPGMRQRLVESARWETVVEQLLSAAKDVPALPRARRRE